MSLCSFLQEGLRDPSPLLNNVGLAQPGQILPGVTQPIDVDFLVMLAQSGCRGALLVRGEAVVEQHRWDLDSADHRMFDLPVKVA